MNLIKWLRVWFTIQWNKITGKRKKQEKERKRIDYVRDRYKNSHLLIPSECYKPKLTFSQTGLSQDYGKEYWDRKKEEGPDLGSFGLGYLAGDILNDSPPQIDNSPSPNEPSFDGFGGGDGGGSGSSGSWDSSDSSSSDSSSYDSGSSDSGSSDSSSSSD